VPVAKAEAPIVVQPLKPQPIKEERVLEPDTAAIPPPTTAVPPMPGKQAKRAKEVITLSSDALFALSSYELKHGARERLDALVAKVKDMEYQTIKVTGHTDPTGSKASNERLSIQRAEAVKQYLVEKGLDAAKIEVQGVGSANPVVVEQDCAALPRPQKIACYQPDRRVEIEVAAVGSRVVGASLKTSQGSK
jgi:OOP family OmpA-OmpF porin